MLPLTVGFGDALVCIYYSKMLVLVLSKIIFLWLEKQLFKHSLFRTVWYFNIWNLKWLFIWFYVGTFTLVWTETQNLLGTNPLFHFNPLIFSVTCAEKQNIYWMIFLLNRKGIYLILLQILIESYFPLDHNCFYLIRFLYVHCINMSECILIQSCKNIK